MAVWGSVLGRLVVVAGLLLAAWLALRPAAVPPAIMLSDETSGVFSAQRAMQDLHMITAEPRVVGTPGLKTARDYLAAQFEALGLDPEITDMTSVEQSAELKAATVAESHDLIARLPGTDSTGAILIGGHLDSVHTTPGAADCGGCAVSVLELARALIAGPALRNDVIFLVGDGEETTRAGSLSFVEQHPWAKDVRLALNQEAMGTAGAAQLYVTGPQNGWLLEEAFKAMPSPVAYSYVNDLVWLSGTGGSDLDQFLMAAPVGLGMVYLNNVPAYHSAQDNPANLDPHTLQQNGDNLLALARHFGNLPLDGALTAPSLVYFNLTGNAVVHYPAWTGIALALLTAIALAVLIAIGIRRKTLAWRGLLVGIVVFLPWVLVVTLLTGAIWAVIRYLDPRLQVFLIGVSYDRVWYTLAFIALAVGLTTAGYALLRRIPKFELSVGALVWWVVFAVVTAFLVPGSGVLFAIPALLGLLPVGIAILRRDGYASRAYWLLLAVAAWGSVMILAPAINFLGIFSGRAELLMNLPLIALLPAPLVAMVTLLLLPLGDRLGGGRDWLVPTAALGISAALMLWIGLTAQFTEVRPKPNMVTYTLEDGRASWITLGANVAGQRASLLDEWTEQFFPGERGEVLSTPWGASYMAPTYPAYQGPALPADLPMPTVEVVSDQADADGLRHLVVQISSPGDAPLRTLHVKSAGEIQQAGVLGHRLDQLATQDNPSQELWIEIHGFPGRSIDLALTVRGTGRVELGIEERTYRLPELDGVEIAPRPAWMMPSPTFVTDSTLVRHTVVLE